MNMTVKQKKFADYYIECGNATEAAIRAGYSKKTAGVIGSENLKKPYILEYIEKRLSELEDKRIANIEEVMLFYSKVLRGKEKDQFGLDAALRDRIEAAKALEKRIGLSGEEQRARIELLKVQKDKLNKEVGTNNEIQKVVIVNDV